jgi:hypothetical protein
MLLETRHIVMLSDSISMQRYRIGLWGLPFAKRECILLVGRDVYGWRRKLAISNEDHPAIWNALHRAGVPESQATPGAEAGRA